MSAPRRRFIVKWNFSKDVWNCWHACNNPSWVDWKSFASPELRAGVVRKTQRSAYRFLRSRIETVFPPKQRDAFLEKTQRGLNRVSDKLIERLENITGHPMYRWTFTCYVTTFPRYPYNFERGWIWISHKRSVREQVAILLHELLHFQFFAYYGTRVLRALGKEKQAVLKEAMTVILNDTCRDLTSVRDMGYIQHAAVRRKLLTIWRATHNMDEFIERAIRLMQRG